MRVELYHHKNLLSMLWNAAQDYSGRKRMQRKSEQEKNTKQGTESPAAFLTLI
jgi:hypothetical protein